MSLTLTGDDLPLACLYRWERERADRVFLTQPYGGGKVRDWTWAQAADDVRRMAAYLQSQGWEPGSRVAILSRNCAWWIMADLAIWMAGHVTVPVYPSLKPESVRLILDHSDAKACFLGSIDERESSQQGVPAGVQRISFPTAPERCEADWEEIIRAVEPLRESPARAAAELATIIYTSGTTGTPKGVMHSFGALAFDAKTLQLRSGVASDWRYLSYLPLAHIVERAGLEGAAVTFGARIFFVEGIETFLADLKRARPTLFLSVPRLLLKFQQGVFQKIPKEKLEKRLRIPGIGHLVRRKVLQALGLNTVRLAACGAAPLPVEVLLWYRSLGLPLVEGYGLTETLITHLADTKALRPGYVGAPLEGVEWRVTESGELLLRSPMNMMGYFKDPEGTRQALDGEGFFHTGDLVIAERDGEIRIVGRAKEQFKTSKGKYVAPAPIECRLAAHPAIEGCCLMGAGLPNPFALVLLSPEVRERCSDAEARREIERSLIAELESLNAELDPHERVAFLAIVDGPWSIGNGILTPTLKLRRTNLEARYLECAEAWRNRNHPVVWESAAGSYSTAT